MKNVTPRKSDLTFARLLAAEDPNEREVLSLLHTEECEEEEDGIPPPTGECGEDDLLW